MILKHHQKQIMPTKAPVKKNKIAAKKTAKKLNKPVKKTKPTEDKNKPVAKKKPVKKKTISLRFSFGGTIFTGYLKPLPKLTSWGIPESYEIHLKGQGDGIISIASGVWVIQSEQNIPQQITDAISKRIEDFYNKK